MTQLQPSRCKQAEYIRLVYGVTPEAGTPFEALLSEHYWAHVSMHFRPGSRIEVFPPEGHYYAELIVRDCGRLYAKVALLRKVELDAIDVGSNDIDLSAYDLKYCGPNAQWCVHRKADKALLKSEFGSKYAAQTWLAQHARTIGRPSAAA